MNMDIAHPRILLTATLVALAHAAPALADCKGESSECVPVGGWNFSLALGAGVRTDPVVHEGTIPLVVIPQFSYYGEHFFIDDLDAGVTFLDSDRTTLSLIASPGYDRVFFYRSDPQNIFVTGLGNFNSSPGSSGQVPAGSTGNGSGPGQPPPGTTGLITSAKFPPRSRQWTYLAGPEWTFKYAGMTGQLDVLHEITGHNHGNEVRAALGIPLSRVGGAWTADVGITWKSAAIVNYYYGAPGIYDAGAALDPFVKLAYSRPLKGKWKITAFVECERLSNAIADSPIVNEHFVTTTFVGLVYAF
ncbi:MAG TPA: MipA/OmpV family protein [Steroidobacteraceae bacterium]|nr:MipA/OmpV family protein [Steroidobacteraceae bacterium]